MTTPLHHLLKDFLPENVTFGFSEETLSNQQLTPTQVLESIHYSQARKQEYATGRYCARQALKSLQYADFEVLKGDYGQPLWPDSLCGSISHAFELTVAVAACQEHFSSLGIDVEKNGRIQPELWEMLFTPLEIHFLNGLSAKQQKLFSTLFFSIKEAAYKMLFPLLPYSQVNDKDFQDLEITFCEEGILKIESAVAVNGLEIFEGRYICYKEHIISYCELPTAVLVS